MFKKILAFISLMVIVVVFFSLFFKVKIGSSIVALPVNHIQILDLDVIHTLPNGDGFLLMNATKAYFDNNDLVLYFYNSTIELNESQNDLKTRSDEGIYYIDKSISAEGNLTGAWNKMDFVASEDAVFTYDFLSGIGSIDNDLVLRSGTITIKAKSLFYSSLDKELLFKNVLTNFTSF